MLTKREGAGNLAVAWSGGADSTALLLLLREYYQVQAWHIDHAWHDNSAAEAALLAKHAAEWGIPFFSRRICPDTTNNREANARQQRYAAFLELANEQQCFELALAHHANDQAETICLRFLQGAGVHGLRGMAVYRQHENLRLWRPLLQCQRISLRQILDERKVSWLEDASNNDLSLRRNHVRHRFFPTIQSHDIDAQKLFIRFGQQATKIAKRIDILVEKVRIYECDEYEEISGVWVDWYLWNKQENPVRMSILQRMYAALFGNGKVLGKRHLLLIERWRAQQGRRGLDLSRSRLQRKRKRLYLTRLK
ncbi:MAG: tRNA lysidine(34) synthetase TilS [Mariprofundales bacterium]